MPANTEWLRQRLRQIASPPAAGQREAVSEREECGDVRAADDGHATISGLAAFPEMSGGCSEASYEAVPDRMQSYKLSRLFRFCSAQGVSPEDACDQT